MVLEQWTQRYVEVSCCSKYDINNKAARLNTEEQNSLIDISGTHRWLCHNSLMKMRFGSFVKQIVGISKQQTNLRGIIKTYETDESPSSAYFIAYVRYIHKE